jgi:hypothetical protein
MATEQDIYDAVKSEIEGLALALAATPTSPVNIELFNNHTDKPVEEIALPAITIAPGGEIQSISVVNCFDDYVYPVSVYILVAKNNPVNNDQEVEEYLDWKETIKKHFVSQRLNGVAVSTMTTLQPGGSTWIKEQNLWICWQTFLFRTREARG